MTLDERATTPAAFLDALLGREGLRVSDQDLAEFYASTYLERNPALDVDDTATKAELLGETCARARIGRIDRLLEVGCGSGELLARMAARLDAREARGVDYSQQIAAVARARTGFDVAVMNGARIPFEEDEFDLVYFADVLEHVRSPVAWLREVARVGRRLAFLVPLEAGALSNVLYAIRRARGQHTNLRQYGHIWRWRRVQVERLMREAGLVLEVVVLHQPPISLEGWNRRGLAVARARAATRRLAPALENAVFGGATLLGIARRAT